MDSVQGFSPVEAAHSPESAQSVREPAPERAAGAVLWRWGQHGQEVAVVHRPHHDDWSLPKGKIDQGEFAAETAAREVHEETGFHCVLSRFLYRVSYPVRRNGVYRDKFVDYFTAEAVGTTFVPNEEVDELRWTSPAAARELLSYPADVPVLAAFEDLPADITTLLLVRHVDTDVPGADDDEQHPLSVTGREQRAALTRQLLLFGPQRVHCAPHVRCAQTLRPLANRVGAEIREETRLSTADYRADPDAGADCALRLAASPGPAVVCGPGEVVPDLMTRLAADAGVSLDVNPSNIEGGMWNLVFRHAARAENGRETVLRLVAVQHLTDDPT